MLCGILIERLRAPSSRHDQNHLTYARVHITEHDNAGSLPCKMIYLTLYVKLVSTSFPGPFRVREKALAPAGFQNHESWFLNKLTQ